MYELRGIEIKNDDGGKSVKVIVRTGEGDIYRSFTDKLNVPVNQGTIRARAAIRLGIKARDLKWPRHITVMDIKGGQ